MLVSRLDSEDQPEVKRFDFSAIGKNVEQTPQGFLRIPANLTRVGVLKYKRTDGSIVRELRPPEEVQRADSIQTLTSAPLTELHSRGMVSPQNIAQSQIGVVESPRVDGNFIAGSVLVTRADAIAKVTSGDFKELSPGYKCRIEKTSGVFNGERYDQIQRNIVYNHVGIGPAGWGRSGSEVALRLDADDAIETSETIGDQKAEPKEKKGNPMKKTVIKLDGTTFEIEIAEGISATFNDMLNRMQTERADAKAEVSRLQGENAALKKEKDDMQTKLDAADDAAVLDKAVAERIDLVEKVKTVDPEFKLDGQTSRQLMEHGLEKAGFDRATFDGKDDAFVTGLFAGAAQTFKKQKNQDALKNNLPPHNQKREDGDSRNDGPRTSTQARADMIARQQERYKKPLTPGTN